MAAAVIVGLPRGWTPVGRMAWVAALGLAAVFLLVNAFCGLTDVAFAHAGPRPLPTAAQRVGAFFGGVAATLAVTVLINRCFGVPAEPAYLGAWGALYVVASTGRPWSLFATVRKTAALGLVPSDRYARLILASVGLLLIGAALWARASDACHLTCVGTDGATRIRL